MAIALSIFGIVFGAFCVWLTVRIINRREKWAKRVLAGIAFSILFIYPLGFGPAHWYWFRMPPACRDIAFQLYWPMYRVAVDGPEPLRDWAARYADWRPFGMDWGQ